MPPEDTVLLCQVSGGVVVYRSTYQTSVCELGHVLEYIMKLLVGRLPREVNKKQFVF